MAGYNFHKWKSVNAVDAESRGLITAGELARRLGVSAAAVRECVRYAERHHVSARCNLIEYYDPARISPQEIAAARQYEADRAPVTWLECVVEWLEWPARRPGEPRRPPIERRLERVAVTRISPSTVLIHAPWGAITKRTTAQGLCVWHEGRRVI